MTLHIYVANPTFLLVQKWVKQRLNIVRMKKGAVHRTTYHNGVNSAYPCTGQHSVDQLWDHGKVNRHPVSLFYTLNKETSRLEVFDNTNHILATSGLLLNSNQQWQCSFKMSFNMLDMCQIL